MRKRVISVLLMVCMLGLMMAGCNNKKSDKTTLGVDGDPNQKKWEEENVHVSWWLVGGNDTYYQTYWTEMKSMQAIQASVGITIDFEVATSYEDYLPMMSAQSYPDVVTGNNLSKYPGRMAGMYNEGVSVNLQPYMDEGLMPNFQKILAEYPDISIDLQLDDGEYTFVSTLYDIHDDADRVAASVFGLAIRQDWLDAVGKDVPTTMDEWYDVLSAFKNQDPNGNGERDEIPICMASSGWKYFLPAYGIDDDPSIIKDENGEEKVIFGYMSPQYKEYLQELNKWYTDGLFENMFEQTSIEKRQEVVINNLAGAWKGEAQHFDAESEGSYLSMLREKAPSAAFAAAPWPKTKDGYQWCFSDINSFNRDSTVITSNAVKNGTDRAAAYLIDYMLSESGSTYLTWGIEGESYEVVDGKKKLMDGMDEKIDFKGANIAKFNTYADPLTVAFPNFGQVSDYVLSQKSDDYVNACKVWAEGDTSYKMVAACQLSVELERESEDIVSDMKNYTTKARSRFITGKEPLTNYDTYLNNVERLGGGKYQDIWQRAYDAYKARTPYKAK